VCIILLSGLVLALDTPILDPKSNLKYTLKWIDNCTLVLFTGETICKIITYGLIFNGEWSYLKNGWNIMDFLILIFSYLCLTPLVSTFKVVKAFKIQKALRLIGRNEGLKVALRALVNTIPKVFTTTVIMILFYMIFAVVGVSFFKGKMFYCSEEISPVAFELVSKWDCLNAGGLWLNRVYNFDNMSNAIITLFVMSTTAAWGENMVFTITSHEINYFPGNPFTAERDTIWIMFFVTFMVIGCFVFLNIFVAVVINTFNSEQDRVGGSDLLTEKQKEWIDMRLLVLRAAPIKKITEPQNTFRRWCFRIMEHKRFESFI
jgi:Ion transport protein